MKRKRVWISRIAVILATAGLVWLLAEIGWSKIARHLLMLGWGGALLLLALGALESAGDALALREAALGRVGFWRVLFLNQAGAMLNSIVGEAGEVLKASLLSELAPGRAASATFVWNIAFRLSKPLVVVAAATVAFIGLPEKRDIAAILWVAAIATFGFYVILLIAIRRAWVGGFIGFISRLPPLRGERASSIASKARDIERTASAFWREHPHRYVRVVVYQVLARLASFAGAWAGLVLLGCTNSFAMCALIFVGTQLIAVALFFMPTRVGTTEGAVYLLFAGLGLDGGLGVIWQLVMRIKQLVVNSVGLLALAGKRHPVAPEALPTRTLDADVPDK
jgi:lysylphosphatidylglycerol synthase-like protein